jgi:hypothetical protein
MTDRVKYLAALNDEINRIHGELKVAEDLAEAADKNEATNRFTREQLARDWDLAIGRYEGALRMLRVVEDAS